MGCQEAWHGALGGCFGGWAGKKQSREFQANIGRALGDGQRRGGGGGTAGGVRFTREAPGLNVDGHKCQGQQGWLQEEKESQGPLGGTAHSALRAGLVSALAAGHSEAGSNPHLVVDLLGVGSPGQSI